MGQGTLFTTAPQSRTRRAAADDLFASMGDRRAREMPHAAVSYRDFGHDAVGRGRAIIFQHIGLRAAGFQQLRSGNAL